MAVDFATLALRVDNADAVRKLDDTGRALDTVEKKAKQTTVTVEQSRVAWQRSGGDMAKFAQELQKMAGAQQAVTVTQTANIQAVQRSGASLNGLREPLTSVTRQLLQLNPAVAQLSSVLGNFALGSGPMIGILAGAAALGFAWNKLTEDSRKAKEEFQRQLDVLRELKREQDLGITGEAGAAVRAGRPRLQVLSNTINSTQALIDGGQLQGQSLGFAMKARDKAVKEYTELSILVQAGEKKVTQILKDESDERIAKAKRETDERLAEAKRLRDAQMSLGDFLIGAGPSLPGVGAMRAAIARPVITIPQAVIQAVQIAAITAEKIDSATARQQAMLGHSALGLVGAMGAGGGLLSSVISGGMAGAGGGPFGVLMGIATPLVSQFLNLGKSSRDAAESMKQLRASVDDFILAQRAQLGLPGADKALERSRIQQAFQAERDKLTAAYGGYDPVTGQGTPGMFGGAGTSLSPEALKDYQDRLAELNRLEKARLDALGREKDAIDKVTRSMVNMVQGYRLQATIFQASTPRGGAPGRTNPFGPRPGSSDSLTVNVTIDGKTVGTAVLNDFRRRSADNGGNGLDWEKVR